MAASSLSSSGCYLLLTASSTVFQWQSGTSGKDDHKAATGFANRYSRRALRLLCRAAYICILCHIATFLLKIQKIFQHEFGIILDSGMWCMAVSHTGHSGFDIDAIVHIRSSFAHHHSGLQSYSGRQQNNHLQQVRRYLEMQHRFCCC